LLAALGAVAGGCDAGVPTFPPLDVDAGIECSEELPCEEDEICLSGRCYARCTTTCGPMEVCVMGACMRGTPPDAGPMDAGPPDVGPPDAGPPDPCLGVRCEGSTPFCRGGVCLECEDMSACGGGAPICDVGRGACTTYAPALCAPCNNDRDCEGMAATFGTCVARGGASEPTERVCLPSCMDTSECPTGYRCSDLVCVPAGGASCTQQLAGLAGRTCMTDAECAPAGATADTGLVTGSCVMGTCRIPCGAATDCPPSLPVCDDSLGGFCRS
jgi:hypothetical protein